MAELKSFKQVILEAPDRQVLYEVLDTIMECSDKKSAIAFYNRRATENIMFDESQLEIDYDNPEHNKPKKTINHETAESPRDGFSSQDETS